MSNSINNTMMINPYTGTVCSLQEWREIYDSIDPEDRPMLWGGENFEDGVLEEVRQDADGDWVAVE